MADGRVLLIALFLSLLFIRALIVLGPRYVVCVASVLEHQCIKKKSGSVTSQIPRGRFPRFKVRVPYL